MRPNGSSIPGRGVNTAAIACAPHATHAHISVRLLPIDLGVSANQRAAACWRYTFCAPCYVKAMANPRSATHRKARPGQDFGRSTGQINCKVALIGISPSGGTIERRKARFWRAKTEKASELGHRLSEPNCTQAVRGVGTSPRSPAGCLRWSRNCFSASMIAKNTTPTITIRTPSRNGTARVPKTVCKGGR